MAYWPRILDISDGKVYPYLGSGFNSQTLFVAWEEAQTSSNDGWQSLIGAIYSANHALS